MAKSKRGSARACAAAKRKGGSSRAASRAKPAASAKKKTPTKKAAARTTKSAGRRPGAEKAATKPSGAKKTGPARGTKGKGPSGQPTSAAKSPPDPTSKSPAPEPAPPIPKTKLSDAQLEEFKQWLLDKRRELVGDMDNLADEALRRRRSEAAGDLSSMPIHMADIGSDNWEQEFTLGLISNERALLREIDDALQRIADRTYGVCLGTHKRITVARLRAKPWAKYCIEYARLHEKGRSP